ncbi:hypothetical protein EMMF5_002650 [Cystobasidiomycetes sp. EMM_F5]
MLSRALGAKVIATAGTAEKLKVAKDLGGADFVLDYTKPGWQDEVKKITKGHGADVIYDPVGMISPSLKCIAWNGRAIVVGFAAGSIEKIPMNLVLLKNISLVRLIAITRLMSSALIALLGGRALGSLHKERTGTHSRSMGCTAGDAPQRSAAAGNIQAGISVSNTCPRNVKVS